MSMYTLKLRTILFPNPSAFFIKLLFGGICNDDTSIIYILRLVSITSHNRQHLTGTLYIVVRKIDSAPRSLIHSVQYINILGPDI